MTWVYLPSTCLPSAPDTADSNSASASPDLTRAPSVWWRGKPMPPRTLSRAWATGGFIQRLSGLTLPLSTLDHGVALFIASLREIHASPTASPESVPEQTIAAGFSTESSTWSTPRGLLVSSARTSRGTPMVNSAWQSPAWKAWATAVRAEFSARPKSEPAISESGSLSSPIWQTPATDSFRSRGGDRKDEMGLDQQARRWPTPRGEDSESSGERISRGVADTLTSATRLWATPRTITGGAESAERKKGRPLERVATTFRASTWSTPTSLSFAGSHQPGTSRNMESILIAGSQLSPPDPATPGGPKSSPERRILNPRFVEWLMGWPAGWVDPSRPVASTSFAAWETASYRLLQHMHGLPLTRASEQKDLFDEKG